jgi:hypothetical protein
MKTTAALLLVALAASGTFAEPAPVSEAAQLAAQGAKLYAAMSYVEAGDRFDKAYALDHTLSYLYNAAQAYRLAKSCALSVARYERFLDAAPKDAQNLDKVRQYLEDERACAKDQQLAQPPAPVPVPQPVAPVIVTPPVRPLPQPAQPEGGHRAAMRKVGIGVGAVGAAVIAYGLYEAWEVHAANLHRGDCDAMHDPLEGSNHGKACPVGDANTIDDQGNAASSHMGIGLSVGAAALVTGGLLYYLGRDPERAMITPTTGGAVMSFGGRF